MTDFLHSRSGRRARSRPATRRYAHFAWHALQAALAATVAWLVANLVHAEDQPFFAPIAALVALTASRGQRGAKAVQLLLAVGLGIVVGELVVVLMGAGYGRVALASFLALFVAAALGEARVALTQAGVSAILTVIAAEGEAGWARLLDAAIGGGVAIVFTQVIFAPEPVALLREAEVEALRGIARGLRQTAEALRRPDRSIAGRALHALWGLPARLGELARVRRVGARMAKHSAIWRSQRGEVRRERVYATQLALVAASSVMLARAASEASAPARAPLAARVDMLAAVLERLAARPWDRDVRQQAVGDALAAARPLGAAEDDPAAVAAVVVLGMVARDIMVFAGLTRREANATLRGESLAVTVRSPPEAPRLPFGFDRRRGERRSGARRRRDDDAGGEPAKE